MGRLREMSRYGIVGLINFASYFALYSGLVLVGVPYVLAAVLAFPLPVALGYWLHEHWTFERGQPSAQGLAGFLALQVTALALGVLVLVALVDGLGMAAIPARAVSMPLGAVLTYIASSVWIFQRPGPADPAET